MTLFLCFDSEKQNDNSDEILQEVAIENKNTTVVDVPECLIATSAFSERAKVTSVCWSPDSSKVAATSDDGFVKLFDVGNSISCINTHTVHRELSREVY